MIPMAAPPSFLAWLRGKQRAGITVFILLLLAVAAERRLAEFQLNQRSAAPAFENDATLDGDEVRVRLIALNDDKPPTLAAAGGRSAPLRTRLTLDVPPAIALGRPAPRGPPSPPASIA